jgi:hypothetical protein
MTKPIFAHQFNSATQAQIARQLFTAPKPRTVHIEDVAECQKARSKEERKRKNDAQRAQFILLLTAAGLPVPTPEYRFAADRKWRMDYGWPAHKVALEVEGGIWIQGRHSRGSGMSADFVKYNRAAILGWRVVKCVPSDLMKPATVEMLRGMLT